MSQDQKLEDKIEKTRKEELKGGSMSFMMYYNIYKDKLKRSEDQTLINEKVIVEKLVKENFKK